MLVGFTSHQTPTHIMHTPIISHHFISAPSQAATPHTELHQKFYSRPKYSVLSQATNIGS